MKRDSRLPGFYKLTIEKRLAAAAQALGIGTEELKTALGSGGLSPETADKISENVLGTYALPFSLALNFLVNDSDYLVPMAVEEPSVVAAASNAAKMIRAGGGFIAESDQSIMIGQVLLQGVPDAKAAEKALLGKKAELIAQGNQAQPELVQVGGGMRDLQARDLGEGMFAAHLLIDCRDAMGANMVNTICEKLAPAIAQLCRGRTVMRILTNLCDQRLVRVTCRVPPDALPAEGFTGEEVRDGVIAASRIAERDRYRATTHNKGIMNGIDAVVIATGNDWRAVEAGAHSFAARGEGYAPLCTWRADPQGRLTGRLEMPLALGTIGGTSRAHPGAKLALRILGVTGARELAMVAASVGMASNLAALRALASEGIQRGHMRLHARSQK